MHNNINYKLVFPKIKKIDTLIFPGSYCFSGKPKVARPAAVTSSLREAGNMHFKQKAFDKALSSYTQAIKLCKGEERALAIANR